MYSMFNKNMMDPRSALANKQEDEVTFDFKKNQFFIIGLGLGLRSVLGFGLDLRFLLSRDRFLRVLLVD
jgi:hypothetical protein